MNSLHCKPSITLELESSPSVLFTDWFSVKSIQKTFPVNLSHYLNWGTNFFTKILTAHSLLVSNFITQLAIQWNHNESNTITRI